MGPRAQTLAGVFAIASDAVPLVLADVTDADARNRSRAGAGPSIAWMVGHLLHYRHRALRLLGETRPDPYETAFASEPADDGAGYPSVAEFGSQWSELRTHLEAALDAASDAALLEPVGGAGPHRARRVVEMLSFLAFHEGYHLGAIGALRKQLGYRAVSELVAARE